MLGLAWRSLGWFMAGVAVALGFLLVPLQVAAERKKLDHTVADIARAKRDIRALETEFDTRANLAQLDQWNNDALRLVAPAAGQYVTDEAALAAIDVRQATGGAGVQNASFVPSAPLSETVEQAAAAARPKPVPESSLTGAVAAARTVAIASPKVQTVALLDRKLLSDSMIGDLRSGAQAEIGRAR